MDLVPALRLEPRSGTPHVVTIVGAGGKTTLMLRLARELQTTGRRVLTTTTTRLSVAQSLQAPITLWMQDSAIPWDDLRRGLDEHGHVMLVGERAETGEKQVGIPSAVVDAMAAHGAEIALDTLIVEGDGSRMHPLKAPDAHEPVIPDSTTLVLPLIGLDAIGALIDEEHTHRPDRIRELLEVEPGEVRLTPSMAARLLVHAQGGGKSVPAGARVIPVLNKADAAARLSAGRIAAAQLARAGYASLLTAAGNPEREAVPERWGPLCAVVLAAGGSRRYGSPKQLVESDGETFVHRAARLALDAGASQVLVVTGAAADQVAGAIADLENQKGSRLARCFNARWEEGQSSSVRAAMAAIEARCEAVLFLPVDQPRLPVTLLRRMVHAWRHGAPLAAPSAGGEVRGAPALFDREFFPELRAVTGDRGGREILKGALDRVAAIPVDGALLADVDRREEQAG